MGRLCSLSVMTTNFPLASGFDGVLLHRTPNSLFAHTDTMRHQLFTHFGLEIPTNTPCALLKEILQTLDFRNLNWYGDWEQVICSCLKIRRS